MELVNQLPVEAALVTVDPNGAACVLRQNDRKIARREGVAGRLIDGPIRPRRGRSRRGGYLMLSAG